MMVTLALAAYRCQQSDQEDSAIGEQDQTAEQTEVSTDKAYEEALQTFMLVQNPVPPKETNDDESFTALNQQIQKALGFLYNEGKTFKAYLAENEEEGRSGLSFVIADLLKELGKEYDEEVTREYVRLLRVMAKNRHAFFDKSARHLVENVDIGKKDPSDSYDFVVDETDDFRRAIENLIVKLPESITNEQIKSISHEYIGILRSKLEDLERLAKDSLLPSVVLFTKRIENLLLVAENLTAEDLKQLLYSVHNKVNEALQQSLTRENANELRSNLETISNSLWQFQDALSAKLPMNSPLKRNFDDLMNLLKQKILKTDQLSQLDDDQLEALKSLLSVQLDKEFNDVDYDKYASNIKSVAPYFRESIYNKLKSSLSEESIQSLVNNLITAAKNDLEKLKDPSKQSNFVLDVKDVDRLADQLIVQMKLMHNKDGRIQFRFSTKDIDSIFINLKNLLSKYYHPENSDDTKNARSVFNNIIDHEKLLEPFEDEVYDLLTSSEFRSKLNEYISSYIGLVEKALKKFKIWDEIIQSELYQAIQKELELKASLPQRVLRTQTMAELSNIRHLSESDIAVLSFCRSHLIGWIHGYNNREANFKGYFRQLTKQILNSGLSNSSKRILSSFKEAADFTEELENQFAGSHIGSQETNLSHLIEELNAKTKHFSGRLMDGVMDSTSRFVKAMDSLNMDSDILGIKSDTQLIHEQAAHLREKELEGDLLEEEILSLLDQTKLY